MRLFLTLLTLLLAWPAAAQGPERDLVLELREIDEAARAMWWARGRRCR